MHRARHLLWILALVALATPPPAHATSVTVQMTGTWSSVVDNASVLNGSITVGGSFVATLVYDNSVLDTDPSSGFGSYFTSAANSDLKVVSGSYTFTPASDVGIGVENNNEFGEDWIFLSADHYGLSGPLPAGVGIGSTAYSNPTLTDSTGTALSSDSLLGVNWSLADYDTSDFYLFLQITGRGANKFIEFRGTLNGIAVLPEPSVLLLLGAGLVPIAWRGRRG